MSMLYDIFEAHPYTGRVGGGMDRGVTLGDAPSEGLEIARNTNGDGHVLYGYRGEWHEQTPPAVLRYEHQEREGAARDSDLLFLHRHGITVRFVTDDGQLAQVSVDCVRKGLSREDCIAAAMDEMAGAEDGIYRAIARICGWASE